MGTKCDDEPVPPSTDPLAQRVEALEAVNSRLAALLRLAEQVGGERDPLRVLENGCQGTREILGARYALFHVRAHDQPGRYQLYMAGFEPETAARLSMPSVPQGLVGELGATQQSQRLHEISVSPESLGLPAAHPPIHSLLAVPLATPTSVYGWLCLTEKLNADRFSGDDERLAVALGRQLSRVYEDALFSLHLSSYAAQLEQELAERKRVEQRLRESEERYRTLVGLSPDAIFIHSEGKIVFINDAGVKLFGATRGEDLLGRSVMDIVQPTYRELVQQRIEQRLEANGPSPLLEEELLRLDGSAFYAEVVASPFPYQGRAGVLVIVRDISERKRAEESFRQLSGQLLRLQDEERRRIARELHDTTAQNLVAIAMNLAVVDDAAAALEPEARRLLADSRTLVDACTLEIRTLSYLLHPPLLEEMGLAYALSWYVDGFIRRSGIRVQLEVLPTLGRLSSDVELALFRIVQESLTNIHSHAASPTATIRLVSDSRHVVLTVADQGHGMLVTGQNQDGPTIGVGLASMRERVQHLSGQFDIQSGSQGTTITVILPVA